MTLARSEAATPYPGHTRATPFHIPANLSRISFTPRCPSSPSPTSSLTALIVTAKMLEYQHAISAATLEALTDTHREIFTRAVRNVLSTNAAEETYAQVLDGLPLSEVERDRWSCYSTCSLNPLHDNHKTLCPGVLERLRQLRDQVDVGQVLKFDSKVFVEMPPFIADNYTNIQFKLIHDFRAAAPGSRAFNIRLVEMVAVAIHQIAAWIWNRDLSLHKHDEMANFVPPKEKDEVFWEMFHGKPPPTYFSHQWYQDYDQYPDGVADGIGYWAESRIFGGVVLFDRRSSEVR